MTMSINQLTSLLYNKKQTINKNKSYVLDSLNFLSDNCSSHEKMMSS